MAVKFKINIKGQATFEFLIFLPFLLAFIGLFVTISGAINGAINQEKSTRAYFYRIIKGNPYLMQKDDLKELSNFGKTIGNYVIGFRERSLAKNSILPCYRMKVVLAGSSIKEDCDKKSADPSGPTFLLKVATLYGICGPIYVFDGSRFAIDFQSGASNFCGVE